MILDGIGMRGDGGHTVNETADLASFPTQIARVALLLSRLRPPSALSHGRAESVPRDSCAAQVVARRRKTPGIVLTALEGRRLSRIRRYAVIISLAGSVTPARDTPMSS